MHRTNGTTEDCAAQAATAGAPYLALQLSDFTSSSIETPAFVYDRETVLRSARVLLETSKRTGIWFTYSVKACAVDEVLRTVLPWVAGFSVSSLFEARLARETIEEGSKAKSIHAASPVYRPPDFNAVAGICDYVSFNSVAQARALPTGISGPAPQLGLRINPGLSYVADERYDPCRSRSKLGTPLQAVADSFHCGPDAYDGISGLHFHSNSCSVDLEQLFETVQAVVDSLPELTRRIDWLNMGGGYLFRGTAEQFDWLNKTVDLVRDCNPRVRLFMEPGESLVGEAGFLVSRVMDVSENDGSPIALVDASVNHLPECFEYQFEPDVLGAVDESEHEYILAGSSCLSGDVFGTYCFPARLAIGDIVVFTGAGAYSVVKANSFTGIPLPSVYIREADGATQLHTRHTYEQYRQRWRKT